MSEVNRAELDNHAPDIEVNEERYEKRSYFREHPEARWLLLVAAIVLVVAGIMVWSYYSVRETTDDAQIQGHITPISARVSGTVTDVNVRDNQPVKAGDILVKLDPTDYEAVLRRAQADLEDARATAQGARTNVPITQISTTSSIHAARAALASAQKEVDVAHARQAEAQANYDRASKDLERYRVLVEKEEVSRQQYDTALAAERAAQATVRAAEAAAASAQSHVLQAQAELQTTLTAPHQLQISKTRLGSAEALVQRAEAAVAIAELNLQYTVLKAAGNGTVSNKTVEVGQVIQPGQPLAALINLDDVWVIANFKENQLRHMKPGQRVKIHVDAYDHDFDGHVDSIGGATGARFSLLPPENATGNYVKVVQRVPVKIVFEKGQDPNHILRPGLSVVPTVLTNSR